jgi:hypothetical protein
MVVWWMVVWCLVDGLLRDASYGMRDAGYGMDYFVISVTDN